MGTHLRRRAVRYATIGTTLGLLTALCLVGGGLGGSEDDAVTNVADRPALTLTSPVLGAAGAEDTALDLATAFQAVDIAPGEPCPDDQLAVAWEDPGDTFTTGSHYAPVGPAPSGVESSNGYVYCSGSDYDHAGFSIDFDGGEWQADLAPDLGADDDEPAADEPAGNDDGDRPDTPVTTSPLHDGPRGTEPADLELPTPAGPVDLIDRLDDTLVEVTDITDLQLTDTWQGIFDEYPLEDPAGYEPQTLCSPSPKAGTVGFSEIVLDAFPSTGSSGISRACSQGERSEHKEGRAWDWSALVTDRADAAAASQVIGWLLATDEHGNEYAMARRLGVMYIIYNRSIWRSYAPEQGWVGYTGPNPHTDHVHLSFSRAGGAGTTSFWDVADLPEVSASDFGPYALLPDAGGVAANADDQPAVIDRLSGHDGGGTRPGGLPVPGGDGGDAGGDDGDDGDGLSPPPPTPTLPLPPVTLPDLPSLPLPDGGGGGGGGGGGRPLCPPGTPLIPVPLNCLLRNR